MKSLGTIMKLSRAGKLISKIILAASIAALLLFLAFFMFLILSLESASGEKYFFEQLLGGSRTLGDIDVILYFIALIMIIISVVYIVNCAYKYFAHTVEKGTPFNRGSVDELKKLGIVTCIVPFVIQIVTGLFVAIATDDVYDGSLVMDYNPVPYVTLGIMILFLAAVSRYGILVSEKSRA